MIATARVLGAVLVLALAGCAGGEPASVAATQPPASTTPASPTPGATPTKPPPKGAPCTLVTGADAATALGAAKPLAPAVSTGGTCSYSSGNGADTVEVTVEKESYRAGLVDEVLAFLDTTKATKVYGVGDAAISYSLGSLGTQFHVWAKGRYLVITVSIISRTAPTEAATRTLAETAVARL